MRLLLVTHYQPPHEGGIERVAEDHARAAAAAGHEVAWIASRIPGNSPAEERLDWGRAIRVPAWNPFERRLGVPWPLWLPPARAVLRREVQAADVVHVHDALYHGSALALEACARARRPALLTQHVGFVPQKHRALDAAERLAWLTLGRRAARRATAVAWYNQGALDWLRATTGYAGPDLHLPNGVDGERFRPAADGEERRRLRARHRLPADALVALFVGRLVAKKGAAALLAARREGWWLLLVGERGELPRDALLAGAELRPFVPRETLAELLRAADALVLPSRGEGLPLVVQEAMASGIAVVLGDDPGYAGEIAPGSAVLVAPEPAAIDAALDRLRAQPELRLELGRRGRAHALARWSAAAARARLLEAYAALAAGQSLTASSSRTTSPCAR